HRPSAERRSHGRGGERTLPACRAPGVSSTLGDTPARVSPDTTPDAGTVTEKYPAQRPQHLSVLRRSPAIERTHARPRDAAVTRRIVNLGKPGGLLSSLQSAKGKSVSNRSRHAPFARAARFQSSYQPPHHATDGSFGRQVAQVPLLLS